MSTLKQLKWNIILLGVAYVILGIVLIVYPSETQTVISYIMAVALILIGIVNLVQYMRVEATQLINRYDLVTGFSAIIGGVLIIINVEKFNSLMLIALGFMVTISGILKLQSSVNLMRMQSQKWQLPFALAIINIVYGVIMLIDPFAEELFFTMMGLGFIFSGITDIIVTVMVSARLAKITEMIMSPAADATGNTDGQ